MRKIATVALAAALIVGMTACEDKPRTVGTTKAAAATSTTTAKASTTKPKPTTTTPKPVETTDSVAEQVSAWYDHYGSLISRLAAANGQVGEAAGDLDLDGLSEGCLTMSTIVAEAQAAPPIPAAAVQRNWASALRYQGSAARHCLAGVEDIDADELEKSTQDLIQSNTYFTATTSEIRKLAGQ